MAAVMVSRAAADRLQESDVVCVGDLLLEVVSVNPFPGGVHIEFCASVDPGRDFAVARQYGVAPNDEWLLDVDTLDRANGVQK